MKKSEWKKIYIKTIAERCGDKKFAKEVFNAGDDPKYGTHYEGDPKDSALEEMSYWEE